MDLEESVEQDIIRFFKDIENQIPQDQRRTLKLLLDKYIHLTQATELLRVHDFSNVVSKAQGYYKDFAFPKYVGSTRRPIGTYFEECTNLCMIEATIEILNGKGCFRKIPKFDYKK